MSDRLLPMEISHEKIERLIDKLTLFNDTLMGKVFDSNTEATQLLLRIILGRDDIHVLEVRGQLNMRSPFVGGRDVTLDIYAVDDNGEHFDVEVQQGIEGGSERRARFHASMMDARMLKKKQAFSELGEAYVIFICRFDKFGKGEPLYHVDRQILETQGSFDDGSRIIYVNGLYKGDDAVGRLMHDFGCSDAGDIYYKPLSDSVRHFKDDVKGRDNMGDIVEEFAKEYAQEYGKLVREESLAEGRAEGRADMIKNLMNSLKCNLEDALNTLNIHGEEREAMIRRING